jgi:hypothetical protein
MGTEEDFALAACALWLFTALVEQGASRLRGASPVSTVDDGNLQAAGRA